MAVLDENSAQLKWFTCHGVAFDSVKLSKDDLSQFTAKTADPFTFYRNYCYERLFYIEQAEFQYRLHGKQALEDTSHNNQAVFSSPSVKSAKSTLQKLVAIEELMRKICLQLRLLDIRSPRQLLSLGKDASEAWSAFAGTMIRRTDSIEYYNTFPLATVAKIVLRRQSPDKLFVYSHDGILEDSVPLKPGKYASLLKEKEDVFLLYRGWLELQWQQAANSRQQYAEWLSKSAPGEVHPASQAENKQQMRTSRLRPLI